MPKYLFADLLFQNSGGSRTVPLKEGEINEIKIEVTAEDGTTKIYWVRVNRLSAKDATLSELKVSAGKLEPEFSPDCLEYNGNIYLCKCLMLIYRKSYAYKSLSMLCWSQLLN